LHGSEIPIDVFFYTSGMNLLLPTAALNMSGFPMVVGELALLEVAAIYGEIGKGGLGPKAHSPSHNPEGEEPGTLRCRRPGHNACLPHPRRAAVPNVEYGEFPDGFAHLDNWAGGVQRGPQG